MVVLLPGQTVSGGAGFNLLLQLSSSCPQYFTLSVVDNLFICMSEMGMRKEMDFILATKKVYTNVKYLYNVQSYFVWDLILVTKNSPVIIDTYRNYSEV